MFNKAYSYLFFCFLGLGILYAWTNMLLNDAQLLSHGVTETGSVIEIREDEKNENRKVVITYSYTIKTPIGAYVHLSRPDKDLLVGDTIVVTYEWRNPKNAVFGEVRGSLFERNRDLIGFYTALFFLTMFLFMAPIVRAYDAINGRYDTWKKEKLNRYQNWKYDQLSKMGLITRNDFINSIICNPGRSLYILFSILLVWIIIGSFISPFLTRQGIDLVFYVPNKVFELFGISFRFSRGD